MYEPLYEYLLLNRSLSIPGIGNIVLERKPAKGDFTNRQILPPSYSFVLQSEEKTADPGFFKWLASKLDISDRDAVIRFNDFALEQKKLVEDNGKIIWQGVGELSKGESDKIQFIPEIKDRSISTAVTAERVIRVKPEHMVRVGEQDRTSAEMEAILHPEETKKSYWWVAAFVTGLVAFVFLGWYFSEKGVRFSSFGNQVKTTPGTAGPGYISRP